MGLHFHMLESGVHDLNASPHPAAFETPHRHGDSVAPAQSQADDDDIDVDDSASAVSKPALPDSPWMLAGMVFALLVFPVVRAAPVVSPPFRPPRVPSRRSLLPPSHAPPRTA